MFLNQSIGRTFDLISIPKAMQQPSYQRGFSCAKIAFKVDDKAWYQYVPQSGPKG